MKKEEVEYIKPTITEKRLWNLNNIFLSFFIGLILIVAFVLVLFLTDINLTQVLILFVTIVIVYSIVLFFLLEPKLLKEIHQPIIKTRTTEKVVSNPVYKQIPIETEKRIYIRNTPKEKKQKQFKFYGSYKSGTYHKQSCRLSRLIKEKYKVGKNTENYFIKNKYKPCKICIQHKFEQLS